MKIVRSAIQALLLTLVLPHTSLAVHNRTVARLTENGETVISSSGTTQGQTSPIRNGMEAELVRHMYPYLRDPTFGPELTRLNQTLPLIFQRLERAKVRARQWQVNVEVIGIERTTDQVDRYQRSQRATVERLVGDPRLVGMEGFNSVQMPPGVGPIGVENFPLWQAVEAIEHSPQREQDKDLDTLHERLQELQTQFALAKMILAARQRGVHDVVLVLNHRLKREIFAAGLEMNVETTYVPSINELALRSEVNYLPTKVGIIVNTNMTMINLP